MEVNPCSIAAGLVDLVKSEFPEFPVGVPTTIEEILLSKELLKSLLTILTDYIFEDDLELGDPIENVSQGSSWSQEEGQEILQDDDGNQLAPDYTDDCSLERKVQILDLISQHPNWSTISIQRHGGKEFKHKSYKKRWEEQIRKGGTIYEKYHQIDRYVYDRYSDARNDFKILHEYNLRAWAIQCSQTFLDDSFQFKASGHWLTNFKNRHGITSRRVTKLVNRRYIRSQDEILDRAKKFQLEFRSIAPSFSDDCIVNTDQVGVNYELLSNRTLSNTGEKYTFGFSRSPTNLATHSHTVQYVISKSGHIVGDVFVCLQEKSGKLGVKVIENLIMCPNVTMTCSKSGKLTSSLFEYFLDNVLVKSMRNDFLFIIDSWNGQISPDLYDGRFVVEGIPNCRVKIIPEKCTPLCQPLDTTFNRQLKYFIRRIQAEATLNYTDSLNKADEVTTRNNIIRMHSLIHYQLSANIFKPMIEYSWFSSGLSEDKPQFQTVQQSCFTFETGEPVRCSILSGSGECCGGNRFIKCANCRKNLCFPCFFYDYHVMCT